VDAWPATTTLSIPCRSALGSGAPDDCRIVTLALCSKEYNVNTTLLPHMSLHSLSYTVTCREENAIAMRGRPPIQHLTVANRYAPLSPSLLPRKSCVSSHLQILADTAGQGIDVISSSVSTPQVSTPQVSTPQGRYVPTSGLSFRCRNTPADPVVRASTSSARVLRHLKSTSSGHRRHQLECFDTSSFDTSRTNGTLLLAARI